MFGLLLTSVILVSVCVQMQLYYRYSFLNPRFRQGVDSEFVGFAEKVRELTSETDSIGLWELGVVGYYTDRYIIDFVGLATPEPGAVRARLDERGIAYQRQDDRLWLAPLIRRDDVASLVHEALPGVDFETAPWKPVSPRARGRIFRRLVYLAILVTAGAVAALGPWGLVAPALLVPAAWLHATLWVRHAAYATSRDAVFFRSGWWNRRASVVPFGKIQSLERAESPFDRRRGMASLRVDTAGASRVAHAVDIPYLDAAVATQVMDRLYDEAGRRAFRW